MTVSAKIQKYLANHQISYHVFSHARTITLCDAASSLDIDPKHFARTVLLSSAKGPILAVLPLNHKLDFAALKRLVNRELEIVPRVQADKYFYDCEPGSHPPLGEAYRIPTLIDSMLFTHRHIYFEPGTHTSVVRLDRDDFRYLMSKAQKVSFSVPIENSSLLSCYWDRASYSKEALNQLHNPKVDDICKQVEMLYPFPILPQQAKELISLIQSDDPNARSALFDCMVSNDTLLAELKVILGQLHLEEKGVFENPLKMDDFFGINEMANVSVFVIANKGYHLQKTGGLGLNALWQQGILSGAMGYLFTQHSTESLPFSPGQAFVNGLLHNVGYLLLGHLFQPEFKLLNRLYYMKPTANIEVLEKKVLGMGHAQRVVGSGHAKMGGWLLKTWGIDPQYAVVAECHHNTKYQGEHHFAVKLIMLCDHLLRTEGLGDGFYMMHESFKPEKLGIDSAFAMETLSSLVKKVPIIHKNISLMTN